MVGSHGQKDEIEIEENRDYGHVNVIPFSKGVIF